MDYSTIARQQLEMATKVTQQTLNDPECIKHLATSYNFVSDVTACVDAIPENKQIELFRHSIKEYQFALFSINQGFYRQAFSTLRLSFELFLAAIEFSSNEFFLRQWRNGGKDIVWSRIIDEDNGLFSKIFIRAFFPALEERASHFRTLSEKVYRECSEFVHGNAATHAALPSDFTFSKETVISWTEKATTIHLVLLFSYFIRYAGEMNEITRKRIEGIFLENLGHMYPVRLLFGAPTDV